MIFEKQPKHSNQGIQLKFCAFKLKAMDDWHGVKKFLHCKLYELLYDFEASSALYVTAEKLCLF